MRPPHRSQSFHAAAIALLWAALAVVAVAGCGSSPTGTGDLGGCDGAVCNGGCDTDSDCKQPLGHCDGRQHLCLACVSDGDCGEGRRCSAGGACVVGCSSRKGCGSDGGVCEVDAGLCVECVADGNCPGERPRCDATLRRCFACLPPVAGESDRCGRGTFCQTGKDGYACAGGCKEDADCLDPGGDGGANGGGSSDGGARGGRCDMGTHQCVSCISDSECAAGKVCSTGACVDGCTAQQRCPNAQTCCGGMCADLKSDATHCGACGNACQGGWNCCNAVCTTPLDDVHNCGGCGIACAVAKGDPACMNRLCAVARCNPGWGDCDHTYATGCETNTDGSPSNCGMCGHECTITHAAPSCIAGQCGIDTCLYPWADCNHLLADGCELDVHAADLANCGACGSLCQTANATPVCKQGSCAIAACNPDWADCNRSVGDGCETSTTTLDDCGGCGAACSAQNLTRSCVGGSCETSLCNPGYADCNSSKRLDGCETPTNGLANCGGCGVACARSHAAASCSSGSCVIASCNPGFVDCDQLDGNGCECDTSTAACAGKQCLLLLGQPCAGSAQCASASCCAGICADTTSDANNCGACGSVCGSGLCGSSLSASMLAQPAAWNFNGNAFFDGASLSGVLTSATNSQTGSILYKNPIATDTADITFDFKIGGGNGADGMGFMIEENSATAVGMGFSGLGIANLNGYGVEIDEWANNVCQDNTPGHMAIDSLSLCNGGLPTMLNINNALPFNLHNGGWHTCTIHLSAGTMSLVCEGSTILASTALPSYPGAGHLYYYGFGGATGNYNDRHEIRNITIRFPTPRCL